MAQPSLYDPQNEHDACGIGMMVNLKGGKTHQLVDSSLTLLENMKHRGAEAADNKSGDGAGIMLQIPHEFILLQGRIMMAAPSAVGFWLLAVGHLFLNISLYNV